MYGGKCTVFKDSVSKRSRNLILKGKKGPRMKRPCQQIQLYRHDSEKRNVKRGSSTDSISLQV